MLSPQVARYLMGFGAVVVIIALIATILALVLRGGPNTNAQTVSALVSYVGLMIGMLVSLAGLFSVHSTQNEIIANQADQSEKLNGHLEDHQAAAAGQQPASGPVKE